MGLTTTRRTQARRRIRIAGKRSRSAHDGKHRKPSTAGKPAMHLITHPEQCRPGRTTEPLRHTKRRAADRSRINWPPARHRMRVRTATCSAVPAHLACARTDGLAAIGSAPASVAIASTSKAVAVSTAVAQVHAREPARVKARLPDAGAEMRICSRSLWGPLSIVLAADQRWAFPDDSFIDTL